MKFADFNKLKVGQIIKYTNHEERIFIAKVVERRDPLKSEIYCDYTAIVLYTDARPGSGYIQVGDELRLYMSNAYVTELFIDEPT